MRAAAIGSFDGIHLGHRSVLKTLLDVSLSGGLIPMAVTFNRHPLEIIDPSRVPAAITPLNEKVRLLKEAGANPEVIDFDEKIRSTSAADWIKKLRDDFDVKTIVLGYDNTFGCDGLNMSIDQYKSLGKSLGVDIITAVEIPGVSSSAIRKAVANGDMAKANQMLGRPFSITATVDHGNSIGHTIGFPTANLTPPPGLVLPKPGVYEAQVKVPSEAMPLPAMVNIGSRPTIESRHVTIIEAHIPDWNGDLYNQEITVGFLDRIRDEIKFDSIEALKSQLEKDRGMIRKLN